MDTTEFERVAWSQYWQSGPTHSCFDSKGPVDTTRWWEPIAEKLPANASVLDLACGGGALIRVLLALRPDLEVTGVDYADSPAPVENAKVMGKLKLEDLPFADNSFDAVVSQFGVEYSDVERALVEAVRVCKPSGMLAFLMHHADSPVSIAAQETIDSIADLITDDGLIRAAVALADLRASGQPHQRLEAVVAARFKQATEQPLTPTREWALNFFAEIMQSQAEHPPAYLAENAKRLFAELKAMALRLSAMREAALTASELDAVSVALGKAGASTLAVDVAVDDQGEKLAWLLISGKS